jgi:GT2 family glycosyltransferase
MWNMGVRASLAQATRCNIAILNNDLELGPDFIANLSSGLRSHPGLAAVSANYDGREFPEKVQAVKGIAAGREDGTGGLAGFAFAVKGEIFQSGCPMFDERFQIWYGDNDFTNNLDKAGASYGIVGNATCTHIGGGSNTSGDGKGHRLTPELRALADEDARLYAEKWAQ